MLLGRRGGDRSQAVVVVLEEASYVHNRREGDVVFELIGSLFVAHVAIVAPQCDSQNTIRPHSSLGSPRPPDRRHRSRLLVSIEGQWHMDSSIKVSGLDHIVLACADVERTLAWYVDLLGLEPVRVDEWRSGSVPFPSARVNAGTIIDLIQGQSDGGRLDHFCFVLDPIDLAQLAASGQFDVVDGPATRFGARGDGTSLYVRDPDGTVIELRHY